jgi:hypothetical protein
MEGARLGIPAFSRAVLFSVFQPSRASSKPHLRWHLRLDELMNPSPLIPAEVPSPAGGRGPRSNSGITLQALERS